MPALPSRRTLTDMLNRVPFRVGLNEAILESLKLSVAKMKLPDKHCVLMFDEMAIEAALSYNSKLDLIEGFEDMGTYRKRVFTDHATMFMACGLRKKWKQPISFYFCESGMSADNLCVTIKDVIRRLHYIGLTVSVSVCDQGGSNSVAVKTLLKESDEAFKRQGKENRGFGFFVDGKETIAIFDVPHLLKCVRNRLLCAKKATFTWNGEHYTASWKDIENLYERDTGSGDFRMLHKLHDGQCMPLV